VAREPVTAALHVASLLVMPVLPVPEDMEGFGIVAVEAAGAGQLAETSIAPTDPSVEPVP
jgi:hypothetical protein